MTTSPEFEDFAESLVQMMVFNRSELFELENFLEKDRQKFSLRTMLRPRIGAAMREKYYGKVMTFRAAVFVMVMHIKSNKMPEVEPFSEACGQIIFANTHKYLELERVEHALTSLATLLTTERGQMRWALEWFRDIGLNVTNPALLASFAYCWKGQFRFMSETMDDFDVAKLVALR